MPNELDRVRHSAGAIMTDGGSASGWTVVGETLQCGHCGGHWVPKPGSGRTRGHCKNCGWLCGMPQCMARCVPEEQMLLNMETKAAHDESVVLADAERVSELLQVTSPEEFQAIVATLAEARRIHGMEYRERIEANIRAIRGA